MVLRHGVAVSVLLMTVACGGSSGRNGAAGATPCATPTAVQDLSKLPDDMPFEEWGTITYLRAKKGFAIVRLLSETTVVELHPKIARAVLDAGYEIVGADNEGFESEIFFKPRGTQTGYFQLRAGPCEGQVTTSMIFGRKP